MSQTIFERLRAYHTEGQPLSELIAEACDVGDELVWALEQMLAAHHSGKRTVGGSHAAFLTAKNALARAYATNGDSNGNGERKSA